MRLLLLDIVGLLVVSVQGEAAPDFPLTARIEDRVHLSTADRADIVQFVAQRTSLPIDGVWWKDSDKILVCCGCYDTALRKDPKRHGFLFILQRTDSGWKNVIEH